MFVKSAQYIKSEYYIFFETIFRTFHSQPGKIKLCMCSLKQWFPTFFFVPRKYPPSYLMILLVL